jgi:FMN-dependent NADH-azoreductase
MDSLKFSPKTLLRIDASARLNGSHSRSLADHFQKNWTRAHPEGRVVMRDLARDPVPHLTDATIAVFQGAAAVEKSAEAKLSDLLVSEIESADEILLSSPLYNFAIPSTLKAYFDHIARFGRTFKIGERGYEGLLAGKLAFVITAQGGLTSSGAPDHFATGYLRTMLSFLGIAPVKTITLNGTTVDPQGREARINRARAEIDALFVPVPEPKWLGIFSEEDRQEIKALRNGQSEAIKRGNAAAYAKLCADDVRLMIPGHEVISGREQLQACEEKLFQNARFDAFVKKPERIERSGDLAIEVGRQEVTTTQPAQNGGVFAARQKYTHVFRRTPEGWRFAILMSNSCD